MTDEPEEVQASFQWKWVGISMVVFILFYFIPLMSVPGGIISGGVVNEISIYAIGIWGIAGVFIISAIMAFLSPGVTVWEAVVSAVGVVLLMVVAISFETNHLIVQTTDDIAGLSVALAVVFAMSYMGAWWGEGNQTMKNIIEEYPIEMEDVEEEEGNEEEAEKRDE